MIILCPCYSQKNYSNCCEPLHTGQSSAKTAEALMRSRYSAYTMANTDYIKDTMQGNALVGYNEQEAKHWAQKVKWIKLNVIQSGMENSITAYVEFEAFYVDGSRLKSIHEKSEFLFNNERWYYIGGTQLPPSHNEPIITRSMNCPCGSQRKYKNCHGK